jgi:hypothetical protein
MDVVGRQHVGQPTPSTAEVSRAPCTTLYPPPLLGGPTGEQQLSQLHHFHIDSSASTDKAFPPSFTPPPLRPVLPVRKRVTSRKTWFCQVSLTFLPVALFTERRDVPVSTKLEGEGVCSDTRWVVVPGPTHRPNTSPGKDCWRPSGVSHRTLLEFRQFNNDTVDSRLVHALRHISIRLHCCCARHHVRVAGSADCILD